MSDNNAEKLQLKRQLENKISQLEDYIDQIKNEKIALNQKKVRLENARDRIATQKANFRKVKSNDDSMIDAKYSWKGSNYDSYKSKGGNLMEADTDYESTVDNVHDSLNIAINEVEKEIAHRTGIISSCVAEINGAWTRISNIFN